MAGLAQMFSLRRGQKTTIFLYIDRRLAGILQLYAQEQRRRQFLVRSFIRHCEKDQCHDSINLFDTRAPNVRLAPVSAATKIRARKGPGCVLGPCTYIARNSPVTFCHHYLCFVDEKAEAGEAPDL